MRRRKEYLRRMPYKKTMGSGRLMSGFGGNKSGRNLLIGISVAVLAVVTVLTVYGFGQLHDKAVEKERLAQAYEDQQRAQANHAGDGIHSEDNSSMTNNSNVPDNTEGSSNVNDGSNASAPNGNSPNGSGVNLVGTENTPEPTTHPSVSVSPSPLPLPSSTPEPTTNGHEFDDEMVIVIDAGHGGYDGGSVVDDVVEKDVNLAVAQEIARLLEEHGGITVVQTRTSDEHLGLQERCDIANAAKCDYFVSVHCNTYEADSSVRGFECHYNEKSSEGASFAQSVSDEMKQYNDMKIRSVKPNNLAVTVHTYCPAILIEMGFLTNAADRGNLTNPEYQKQLAERITKAVLKTAGL